MAGDEQGVRRRSARSDPETPVGALLPGVRLLSIRARRRLSSTSTTTRRPHESTHPLPRSQRLSGIRPRSVNRSTLAPALSLKCLWPSPACRLTLSSAKVHSRGQRSTLATGWPRSGHHSATISSCKRIPRGLGASTLTISSVNACRTRTWGRIILCSRPRHCPVRSASRPPLALRILFREHQVRFECS
jgi:hypothetical protein